MGIFVSVRRWERPDRPQPVYKGVLDLWEAPLYVPIGNGQRNASYRTDDRPRLDVRRYDWFPESGWMQPAADAVIQTWIPVFDAELASYRSTTDPLLDVRRCESFPAFGWVEPVVESVVRTWMPAIDARHGYRPPDRPRLDVRRYEWSQLAWIYVSLPASSSRAAWVYRVNDCRVGFMKKNVAGQAVGAQMVTATDGSAFTGSVTVLVTGDAGAQATGSVGSGACTHEGNGYHTYAPAQAETNYALIAFTFTGTGAVPQTVQVYTSFPQTADVGAGVTVTTNNDKTGYSVGVGGIGATAFAAGAIDATAIAADAIGASEIAADAIGSSELAATAANEIADALLARNIAGGSSAGRIVTDALRRLRNRVAISAGTATVYAEDDTAAAWTAAVTTAAGNPVVETDPA